MNDHTVWFTRVKSDVNGNPRYVCHFVNLSNSYAEACVLANKIGGRKFNTKKYGGGIVFQSYSLTELVAAINQVAGTQFVTAGLNQYKN